MRANLSGDLILAVGSMIDGPEIPTALEHLPAVQLRYVNSDFIDAAGLSTFYLDEFGQKHAVMGDAGWQPYAGAWNDQLVRDGDVWRKRSSVDILLTYISAARWAAEVRGVFVVIGGDDVPVSTDRGDDRIALLGEQAALSAGLRSDGATFKFADGVSRPVTNTEMAGIVQAAFVHIQGAFNTERALVAGVTAQPPTVVSEADVNAAFANVA